MFLQFGSPTEPLAWWEGGEILGGRDGLAGGTWLACSKDGRLAFLTNVREVRLVPQAKSRGDLPIRFLKVNFQSPPFICLCWFLWTVFWISFGFWCNWKPIESISFGSVYDFLSLFSNRSSSSSLLFIYKVTNDWKPVKVINYGGSI